MADPPVPHPFTVALDAARDQLKEALQERRKWDTKIAWLQATIATLQGPSVAAAENDAGPLADVIQRVSEYAMTAGITDSCRKVLIRAGRPLQIHELVIVLRRCGFDTERYVNAVAAVASVLNRLSERGQVRIANRTSGGRPRYEWVPPTETNDSKQ